MKNIKNKATFIIIYLVLLIPTYVLPYFGSNSAIVNTLTAAAGWGPTPQWWMHAWCLAMLVIITVVRSQFLAKSYLIVFPALAGIFDLTPMLSSIPLVPSVMHLCALLIGMGDSSQQVGMRKEIKVAGVRIAGIILTIVSGLGIVLFVSGLGKTQYAYEQKARASQSLAVETKPSKKEVEPVKVEVQEVTPSAQAMPKQDVSEATSPSTSSGRTETKKERINRAARLNIKKTKNPQAKDVKNQDVDIQYIKID